MIAPRDLENYSDIFSDGKFWKKVGNVAKKAGIKVIYCALVLYYALQNPSISSKEKMLILGALGYFILPIDLIPDFLPGVGFTDDIAALVFAIIKLNKSIDESVKDQARAKLHEWFGNYNDNEIILDPDDYEIK